MTTLQLAQLTLVANPKLILEINLFKDAEGTEVTFSRSSPMNNNPFGKYSIACMEPDMLMELLMCDFTTEQKLSFYENCQYAEPINMTLAKDDKHLLLTIMNLGPFSVELDKWNVESLTKTVKDFFDKPEELDDEVFTLNEKHYSVSYFTKLVKKRSSVNYRTHDLKWVLETEYGINKTLVKTDPDSPVLFAFDKHYNLKVIHGIDKLYKAIQEGRHALEGKHISEADLISYLNSCKEQRVSA